ncbi:thiol-disulfide isomerase/thioredoxin [Dichotomicrobium thermohalophilum]|uniref:Thiol-disulfide isomerase/thioredoxin n=2 Tax=Dichotomicrobium thermohalophilum TaxID=933063 RepID=A0A397Q480_9HYPH|nr:thiol-disulfide isomerase/thioredoxin [Dichotomicrobium thermohalophilum]
MNGKSANKTPRGPGFTTYIAGMALAAIAGFAAAEFMVTPVQQPVTVAQQPTSSAGHAAQAAQKDTGLDKLVVHGAPREVPEFSFIDGEGETRTLADWRGKLLLVNIWATWCAPCKEEMPSLDRLEAKLGGENFAVLPISVDRGGLKKPRGFLDEIGADNLPLLLDETARLNFKLEVMGLPATLIIDEQGREIARMIGPAEWDSPEAIARLRQFMAAEG